MPLIVNEKNVKSILSKSNLPVSDYSVNPYIGCQHSCRYCYASFMKRFTNHTEPWGDFVDVKYWQDIKNPRKYAGKEIFLSSVTDPYHPLEKKYKRTRAFLEQMKDSGCRLSIATKSDLVLRDIDLIKTYTETRIAWSINTLDEEFKSDMDKAVSIERRFNTMQEFHKAGIQTVCFISPIFPGITDVAAIIQKAKDKCDIIWLENLNLRGDYKRIIFDYISRKYSTLLPLYREIYIKNDRNYWIELDKQIRDFTINQGLKYVRNTDDIKRSTTEPPWVVNYFYHEEIIPTAKKKIID